MAGKTYDIFISNRRTASESAQLISSSLKDRGYDVFLDVESLRSGKFNEQLYVSLTHAKISCWCFPMERLNDAPTRGLGPQGGLPSHRGEKEHHPNHAFRLLMARDNARRDGVHQRLPRYLCFCWRILRPCHEKAPWILEKPFSQITPKMAYDLDYHPHEHRCPGVCRRSPI